MVIKILVADTDILIDYLRQSPKPTLLSRLIKQKKIKVAVAAVALTEIWRGKSIEETKEKQKVEKMLKKLKIIVADEKISKLAGELLRKNSHLMLADALVAATALVLKGSLATFNRKHFLSIKELNISDNFSS